MVQGGLFLLLVLCVGRVSSVFPTLLGCVDLVYMLHRFLCAACSGAPCGSKASSGVGFYVSNHGAEVPSGFVCTCAESEVRWHLTLPGIRKDVLARRRGRELNCNILVEGAGTRVRFGLCEFKPR